MISLLPILALALVLGMRHATDADHVVAVTTIVSRERFLWRAAMVGMIWGIGHTFTIVVVGSAILLLGWTVPPRLGLSLEFSVAIMLMLLGAWSMRSWWRDVHTAVIGHAPPAELLPPPDRSHRHGIGVIRPLLVGTVHGLAGSAAVALLVLPVIHNRNWALIYLLVFGLGTIAGMMLITAAMALPFTWSAARSTAFNRGLGRFAALCAVGFGVFMLYEIGIVDGLMVH